MHSNAPPMTKRKNRAGHSVRVFGLHFVIGGAFVGHSSFPNPGEGCAGGSTRKRGSAVTGGSAPAEPVLAGSGRGGGGGGGAEGGKVSSGQIAQVVGVSDAQVRRDLAALGHLGRRGIGYEARELATAIRAALGIGRTWRAVLVGVGNLARALLRYRGFRAQG